jgi:hypothetical protein
LSACSVLLPVIGPRWLHVRQGLRRRLFLPNDFVRLEILAALKRPIELIPVLVGGATMPPANALPKSITALAERNAMQVTDNSFREDVAALAAVITARLVGFPEVEGEALQSERDSASRKSSQLTSARHYNIIASNSLLWRGWHCSDC